MTTATITRYIAKPASGLGSPFGGVWEVWDTKTNRPALLGSFMDTAKLCAQRLNESAR